MQQQFPIKISNKIKNKRKEKTKMAKIILLKYNKKKCLLYSLPKNENIYYLIKSKQNKKNKHLYNCQKKRDPTTC